ncbi:MAG: glycosyltransferase family 1 protein [Candidatus Falkowbacteria bacterium]|nr:glycosyltransferase family 1 protein [Candidatus Falkowbacteria bacterium]
MKIGVDIRVLMDKHYSGISEYTANLLSAILKADKINEYKLFYNSYHDLGGRLNKWNSQNFQVIGLHWPNKIFNYCLQKVFGYPRLDKVLGGADIFWSPHFNFTKLSGSKSGLKKVITVHDLSFLRYPRFFSWRKNFWHKSLGVKRILRQADKIIAVSANTKNDIMELAGIGAAKIKVIYSGNNVVKKDWVAEKVETCLSKLNISGPFILYVGNIEPRKNISGLIKAYDKLRRESEEAADNFKNLGLILAGAPGWKNAPIYADWQASPYKDQIKFLGYIDEEVKEILYSRAAVFVYPSYYEGFGFPPLEAMTYGLPVVCSNVSSLPEIVAGAGIMVNPYKSEEIFEAIKLVLTDAKLRVRLIALGYARAQMFSWDKTAGEYLELFKELHEIR